MHIPDSMLQGRICPVTAAVSVLGLALAARAAIQSGNKPNAERFGAVTALIFAGQMMNFPIRDGASGHLIGGVLASALLGAPFGVLAMALVLTIQCLMFSDGGLSILGANILNMALIGAGLGGFLQRRFFNGALVNSLQNSLFLGFLAWLSVVLAALACSAEIALSGAIPFSKVAGAMLGTHALIGIGEGLITAAACMVFSTGEGMISKKRPKQPAPDPDLGFSI